jgi:hypothetical protein
LEQISIDPERLLTVTMPARKWNVITFVLNKHAMPFEVVAPVISDVSEQLLKQADRAPLSTEEVVERTAEEG